MSTTAEQERCRKYADGTHCTCWWDATGPCCGCGDDPGPAGDQCEEDDA